MPRFDFKSTECLVSSSLPYFLILIHDSWPFFLLLKKERKKFVPFM